MNSQVEKGRKERKTALWGSTRKYFPRLQRLSKEKPKKKKKKNGAKTGTFEPPRAWVWPCPYLVHSHWLAETISQGVNCVWFLLSLSKAPTCLGVSGWGRWNKFDHLIGPHSFCSCSKENVNPRGQEVLPRMASVSMTQKEMYIFVRKKERKRDVLIWTPPGIKNFEWSDTAPLEYWRKLYTRARISKQGKYIKLPSVSHCVLSYFLQSSR